MTEFLLFSREERAKPHERFAGEDRVVGTVMTSTTASSSTSSTGPARSQRAQRPSVLREGLCPTDDLQPPTADKRRDRLKDENRTRKPQSGLSGRPGRARRARQCRRVSGLLTNCVSAVPFLDSLTSLGHPRSPSPTAVSVKASHTNWYPCALTRVTPSVRVRNSSMVRFHCDCTFVPSSMFHF